MGRILRYLLFALAATALLLGGWQCGRLIFPQGAGADFLRYWAAARLLLDRENPYDGAALSALQRSAWTGDQLPEPPMMWNPPQIFSATMPFAAFNFPSAFAWWFAASLVLIVGSCGVCVLTSDRRWLKRRHLRWSGLLLLAAFPPFASTLRLGQSSAWLLAGLAGYLACRSREKSPNLDFLAGLCLSLTLFKPHLLYLLYLQIGSAALRHRRFWLPIGVGTGWLALSVAPLLIHPGLLGEYSQAMTAPPILWQTPTLGSWLQGLLNIHQLWIRFLPSLITSLVWLLYARSNCDLRTEVLLLIPLSLLTSPYGWDFDQALLAPTLIALMAGVAILLDRPEYRKSKIGPASIVWVMAALAVFSAAVPSGTSQHYMIWYPVVFVGLGMWMDRQLTAS